MHVLIATDGSSAAKEATRWVGENLSGLQRVTIVTLYRVPMPLRDVTVDEWRGLLEQARDEAEDMAREARRALQEAWQSRSPDHPVHVDLVVRPATGRDVSEEIVQLAIERHVDLIAMRSRGLSGLKGLFVGSVSQGVLHRSRVPVLVVPKSAVAVAAG